MRLGTGNNLILGNTIRRNGRDGIDVLTNGNVISGNLIGGNLRDAISTNSQFNLIQGNQLLGHTAGCAIRLFGDNSAYRDNMMRNNSGAICDTGTGNTDEGGNVF